MLYLIYVPPFSICLASDKFITIQDPLLNIDYVYQTEINDLQKYIQFTIINSLQSTVCLIVVYDITSYTSFCALDGIFIQPTDGILQRNFQYVFLVATKHDLEEYREVNTIDGERYAKQNQMTYFEVSAKSGKSIEMLKKMVRIKSAQMMKKFSLKPQQQSLLDFQNGRDDESIFTNPMDKSERSDGSSSSSSGRSEYCTPPKFPIRAELSPDF